MEVKNKIKNTYKIIVTDEPDFNLKNFVFVYTNDDKYVGTVEDINSLFDRGIFQIEAFGKNSVCSIGFNEDEQKWYGWSHRAIYGFGIGHIVKEGSIEAESGWTDEYLKEHPEENLSVPVGFECKTLEDCKKCAIAFAESVA